MWLRARTLCRLCRKFGRRVGRKQVCGQGDFDHHISIVAGRLLVLGRSYRVGGDGLVGRHWGRWRRTKCNGRIEARSDSCENERCSQWWRKLEWSGGSVAGGEVRPGTRIFQKWLTRFLQHESRSYGICLDKGQAMVMYRCCLASGPARDARSDWRQQKRGAFHVTRVRKKWGDERNPCWMWGGCRKARRVGLQVPAWWGLRRRHAAADLCGIHAVLCKPWLSRDFCLVPIWTSCPARQRGLFISISDGVQSSSSIWWLGLCGGQWLRWIGVDGQYFLVIDCWKHVFIPREPGCSKLFWSPSKGTFRAPSFWRSSDAYRDAKPVSWREHKLLECVDRCLYCFFVHVCVSVSLKT